MLGRDLIGVQNLMKKHQALQAELTGHEPRIESVCQSGQDMINEGHFAADDIQEKIDALKNRWQNMRDKANSRESDLEDSLQAQQYFAEANEADSWMREKEPIVANPDYGKDEDSAEVRLGARKLREHGQHWMRWLNGAAVLLISLYCRPHQDIVDLLCLTGLAEETRSCDIGCGGLSLRYWQSAWTGTSL